MKAVAIRTDGLGKKYLIGETRMYKALRESLSQALWAPFRAVARLGKEGLGGEVESASREIIWALKDVSFDVQRGEVLGVIGRNGAGKTTLLKILSRITEPTEGYAELHGRAGSLLEVGTGFHAELSGRENIFLNGAILGMKRQEIQRKFDAIVAFSEVEQLIDTPVKLYSSGQYLRLAFSVAAHLEPDILLVDEVLAVGDIAFQKKCLAKMGETAEQGRTVIFVSHDLSAVRTLCTGVLLLEKGQIAVQGETQSVIEKYLADTAGLTTESLGERMDRLGSGQLRFTDVRLLADGREAGYINWGQELTVEIDYMAAEALALREAHFQVTLSSLFGPAFIGFDSRLSGFKVKDLPRMGVLRCRIPDFPLLRGRYRGQLSAWLNGVPADQLSDAFELEVLSAERPLVGPITVAHKWELKS